MKKILLFSILLLLIECSLFAQNDLRGKQDTSKLAAPAKGPKPYNQVITARANTQSGLLTIHTIGDSTYFEIADSLLGRDILIKKRVVKNPRAYDRPNYDLGYSDEGLGTSIIRFEKGPKDKLFIRNISYNERSKDSTMPMYWAVKKSSIYPIVYSTDIKAYHKDSINTANSGVVINATGLLNGDDELFFGVGKNYSPAMIMGAYQPDKSYLQSIKTYPSNTEITSVKTHLRPPGIEKWDPTYMSAYFSTLEINTSFLLLPKMPMQDRKYDNRIGYLKNTFKDFDSDPQSVKTTSIIARWRLEPKEEDKEKYYRGELVEPKKPIIIYIDWATPKQWVPFLIQAVNDWQPAFEKAGFKNAIIGKLAPNPEDDTAWSMDDITHSSITYQPNTMKNSNSPFTYDPRSGEILVTQFNWYHNLMEILHDWFFIQASAAYQGARKINFDKEVMGRLVRYLVAHQIGHTLGLVHNEGASSATPVEKLRDKQWVEKYGITPSIMDNVRFNYVAQPQDNFELDQMVPGIGDYDKWAIEWGYRLLPGNTTEKKEQSVLNGWVIEKSKESKYWYGREGNAEDPRSQSEDLGDNTIKAAAYGISNLKYVLKNLPAWTKIPNEDYNVMGQMYTRLLLQFGAYINQVQKNIGGRYENLKTSEQEGDVYQPVPVAVQKEAVNFLNQNVFATPDWIFDKTIAEKVYGSVPTVTMAITQTIALSFITMNNLNKMVSLEATYGTASYNLYDLLNDLQKGVWTELNSKQELGLYRRMLQGKYIERLNGIIHPKEAAFIPNDNKEIVLTEIKDHLKKLKVKIKATFPIVTDTVTKAHYELMVYKIQEILTDK